MHAQNNGQGTHVCQLDYSARCGALVNSSSNERTHVFFFVPSRRLHACTPARREETGAKGAEAEATTTTTTTTTTPPPSQHESTKHQAPSSKPRLIPRCNATPRQQQRPATPRRDAQAQTPEQSRAAATLHGTPRRAARPKNKRRKIKKWPTHRQGNHRPSQPALDVRGRPAGQRCRGREVGGRGGGGQ